jgi:hypothetical protein
MLYFLSYSNPMVGGVFLNFPACERAAHDVVNTIKAVDTASCFEMEVWE